MLTIWQEAWDANDETALHVVARAAFAESTAQERVLLLPVADDADAPPTEAELRARVLRVAAAERCIVAGAAPVDDRLLGFIATSDGGWQTIAQTLPEITRGFAERTSALSEPQTPPMLATAIGTIGLLVGDDVLAPHLVRLAALGGVEILLNPCSERPDAHRAQRQMLRSARAYENLFWLASASPRSVTANGARLAVGASAIFCTHEGEVTAAPSDASHLSVEPDIEALRLRRRSPFVNFLPMLRTGLYAREYAALRKPNATAPNSRAGWAAEGERRAAAYAQTQSALAAPDYGVLLVQTNVRRIPNAAAKDEVIAANLRESLAIAAPAFAPNTKLVVFPEYWLQGVNVGGGFEGGYATAIDIPGRETEQLSEFARQAGVYIAGAAFERHKDWPGRYFNTGFIIDPSGEVIHKYRKIQCGELLGFLCDTTPGNVLSEYLDKYGLDGLFPVAKTPLGNLATIVCFDINFPETVRALVKRGAEVILHPTAEPHHDIRLAWDKARAARALESTCYILSACIGGEYRKHDDVKPEFFHRGYSKIVNFDGTLQAVADAAGETPLMGRLDIAALRRARLNPRLASFLWDEPAAYVEAYAKAEGFPDDAWAETPMQQSREGIAKTLAVMKRYEETGRYTPPKP
jgi:predicted amidohydrolase